MSHPETGALSENDTKQMIIEDVYSQTCIKQSPAGGTQSDLLTEVTFE